MLAGDANLGQTSVVQTAGALGTGIRVSIFHTILGFSTARAAL